MSKNYSFTHIYFIILLGSFTSINNVSAKGQFYLRMVKYLNWEGRDIGGSYCDGVWFAKINQCDHIFRLKLDAYTMAGTGLLDYTTPVYHESDHVYFGSHFGNLVQPMSFAIDHYAGSVKMELFVTDHDYDSHDHVDTVQQVLVARGSLPGQAINLNHPFYNGRNQLEIQFWFVCLVDYYRDDCNTYCKAQNDYSGHYICDGLGNKVCLSGWVKPAGGCVEKHPCHVNVCKNGATCTMIGESYTCSCPLDYSGTHCESWTNPCLTRNPCTNGGTCRLNSYNQPVCNCTPQFTGDRCQDDVNECLSPSNPCHNNGTCQNTLGGFTCNCGAKFKGSLCQEDVNECAESTTPHCYNGGQCENIHGDFICRCPANFTGPQCQEDVNECFLNPSICQHNSSCINTVGSYQCNCSLGYQGRNCENHVCSNFTCYNEAKCSSNKAGSPTCICKPGYSGELCQANIDDCAKNVCQNGATCSDLVNDYFCACPRGYSGKNCETDVDECRPNPCYNGGLCTDLLADYSCNCSLGFFGKRCEYHVCFNITCLNKGSCKVDPASGLAKCDCVPGYAGERCQTNINDCSSSPCKNGASCKDGENTFSCSCTDGYSGHQCEVKVDRDDCIGVRCRNQGVCKDEMHNFTCVCTEDYSGRLCEFYRGVKQSDSQHQVGAVSGSTLSGVISGLLVAIIIILAIVVVAIMMHKRPALFSNCVRTQLQSQSSNSFDNAIYSLENEDIYATIEDANNPTLPDSARVSDVVVYTKDGVDSNAIYNSHTDNYTLDGAVNPVYETDA